MLIGVIGFIGSGKGTVGDHLNQQWGFKKDSFAKPLKDAVSIIFGWDRDLLEGDTDESREWREKIDPYWSKIIEREITPRLALQLFGTECIREVFHPNVWSASLIKRYDANIIVTDCRFQNEIKAIKDAGGYIIRVKRGLEPEWYEGYMELLNERNFYVISRLREAGHFPHESETNWIGSKFDYTLMNDGTLREFKIAIDEIMNLLFNDETDDLKTN